MPEQVTKLRVFVASPGDVAEERERLSSVIDELNQGIAGLRGLTLELVRWETHAWPDIGEGVQDVINREIGPYDVFIGIMWKRFGTPTKRAGSGTEEEYNRAYTLWEHYERPKILFYFNCVPFYPSSDEEIAQMQKVLKFKERLREKGVFYWEYHGSDEFEDQVRRHLTNVIRHWDEEKLSDIAAATTIERGTYLPRRNPYFSVSGVATSDLFFNRERDLIYLLGNLLSDSPQCYSIIGQSKIGKTSLLQELARPETARRFGFSPERVFFVYLDGRTGLESEEDFYKILLDKLRPAVLSRLGRWPLVSQVASSSHPHREEWALSLDELDGQGYNIIALFDEFERAIIRRELIESNLFETLMSQVRHIRGFAWVACTPRPLQDIFEASFAMHGIPIAHQKNLSGFFVDAINRHLKLFSDDAALELIVNPAKLEGLLFSEKDIEHIKRWGGRSPFFIQRACYYLFEVYGEEAVDYHSVAQQYLEEAKLHWERYWRKLDQAQQALLVAIAFDRAVSPNDKVLGELARASLVYKDKGKIYPFSEAFRDWIKEKSKYFGEEIWHTLDHAQQQLLTDIALDRVKSPDPYVLNTLESDCLVYGDEIGQLSLFSEAFRNFIRSKAPSAPSTPFTISLSDEQIETLSNWFEEVVGVHVREERGYDICHVHYGPPYAEGKEEDEIDVYARKETTRLVHVLVCECKLRIKDPYKLIVVEEIKELADKLQKTKTYEQRIAEERKMASVHVRGMLFTNAPDAEKDAKLEAKRSGIRLMHVSLPKDWTEKALRLRSQHLEVREIELS